jgi:hypothetical protein
MRNRCCDYTESLKLIVWKFCMSKLGYWSHKAARPICTRTLHRRCAKQMSLLAACLHATRKTQNKLECGFLVLQTLVFAQSENEAPSSDCNLYTDVEH